MKKKFIVTKSYTQEVFAETEAEAEELAEEAHMESPDYDTCIKEVSDISALTIKIWPDSNGEGYQYEVYDSESPDEDAESIGGGLCTGSIVDAVEMAADEAKSCITK